MLGLYCFFYTVVNALCFVHFDIDYDFAMLLLEAGEKLYLGIGILATLMLVPLAVTSTDRMMRCLGKNWRRLHRSVYLIAILAVAHYWLSTKPGIATPWFFTMTTALLLGYRVWAFASQKSTARVDDGMEAPERR